MNIHKRTRLTPLDREEIWRLYQTRQWKISHLADRYRVSRPTIYAALKKARLQQFVPSNKASTDSKGLDTIGYNQYIKSNLHHLPQKVLSRFPQPNDILSQANE